MIDKIIDEIPGDALMYLINALCFDAKWLEKYEKDDISDGIFTNYDKSEANVKYLNSEEGTWLCGEGATGFAKSYIGGKYSFVGLLPDEGVDVYDFAQGLTGEEWLSLWNNRTSEEVKVKIPEFSYYADMKLKDVLTSLGVSDMFDGSADFSALVICRRNTTASESIRKPSSGGQKRHEGGGDYLGNEVRRRRRLKTRRPYTSPAVRIPDSDNTVCPCSPGGIRL